MLPENEMFNNYFKEHFIIYKPRETVSGDFYWIRSIQDYVIMVVADCTGHGVPGGFMSMLGISLLNDIVRRNIVSNAGEALNELRLHLKESLHQTDMKSLTKDGIDIGLIAINKKNNTAFFAGANSKLFLFRNGELIEYKGDRMPVGVYKNERNFTNHSIQLQKGDRIYMFSDGYID